ncbi:MAG: hypothetical protein II855_03525 [Candidatus Methanomethylophilaceae archaeon]|nr:hypothetical protein [Candidatus Methanomethylophilaceae archaeon]
MEFGISYVGLIYLLMLFIPNIMWSKAQPLDYDAGNENRILLAMERAGEVAVTCIAPIFSDFNLRPWTAWSWWMVASFSAMVLYEVYWARYFRSGRTMRDQYGSMFGIPVPGSSLPVVAFLLLAVYGCNPILAVAASVLGIGHIGIHLAHARECGAL